MKIANTTGDFEYFCKTYEERIQHLCDAGFRYIDLNMFHIYEDDELLVSEKWRDNAKCLKEFAEERGMKFVQAHSPGGNPLRNDDQDYIERLFRATVRSIEVCGELGIPNTVVHLGVREDLDKDGFFEENRKFYEQLFPYMEEHNVNVLCENMMNNVYGTWTYYHTNTGAEMKEFIEYVDHPLVHGCWDTGHANQQNISQYDNMVALGKDLYAVHINDNRGERDEHMMPFLGTVNMDEVMCALIDIGYKGYFTLEAGSSMHSIVLRKKKTFARENRLFEPTLSMQKSMEKLQFEFSKHILEAYDCFEE